ncbi:DNA topoisomerase 1-like [Drosophila innubila]|uniref:DNA topoisomerase 1-like n=1 Tax=Drosophila innubila TaxID=198719 RepID=UPI00148E2DBB|nr:DNA topoisomerase 1-like [Drosophila innubila]
MSVEQASSESSWHQELGVSGQQQTIKWRTLKHNGPVFAPPYIRLPPHVKFYYKSRPVELSEAAEEAATLYAKILKTDIAKNPILQSNFFKCFVRLLHPHQREFIKKLSLCNFKQIHEHCQRAAELKSRCSKDQLKQQRQEEMDRFGYCEIDGQLEKIANYRIEPPGIFRGRGNHPLIGLLKPRVQPEDITINCSDGWTPAAPEGHSWKKTLHNNKVSWLARWRDSMLGKQRYIWLSSASRLEGIRDLNKFETARRLSLHIRMIRLSYRNDWHSEDLRLRQRGVALYLIDRLMLRVGNEKQENTADTEGCCTLRVEHLKLCNRLQGVPHVVVFNFLGKDSIKFYRKVAVNSTVFANLRCFLKGKQSVDLVFDLLLAKYLNRHLKMLMEGLTAKVFRTYNASKLLQKRLDDLTHPCLALNEKLHVYTKANAMAAQFCNHRRAMTKANSLKLLNWQKLIKVKQSQIVHFKKRCRIKRHFHSASNNKKKLCKLQSELSTLKAKLEKDSVRSNVALTTSKVNYLDPRITVAWCKRNNVPIEKVFNSTLRNKFKWAIRATNEDFRF